MRGFADLNAAFEDVHGDLFKNITLPTSMPLRKTNSRKSHPKKQPPKQPRKSAGVFDLEDSRISVQDPETNAWVESPVGFREFCESKEHMNLMPSDWEDDGSGDGALSKRQYEDCMVILGDDPKKMFEPSVRKYIFGGLLWAKGSGKDFICSVLQAYIVYILLCLRNPQDFFGFAAGEPCDILNVGKKGQQAERVYFTKFRARILNWPWLLKRYNVVDEGKRHNFIDRNHPYCKIGTRSAEWSDKMVRAYAENSGDPQAFEGYNIIFYICDEISGWLSETERNKAEVILSVLRTSQGSRNTRKLTGLGLAISYPRQDDDIMFKLEKESKEEGSKLFFSRGYQWDIKPKRFYSGETFQFNAGTDESPDIFEIPVELDKDFFDKNPEKAKMMYLLQPPPVQGAFFEYIEKIDAVAYADREPLFRVTTSYMPSVDGQGNKIFYVREKIDGLNRSPDPNVDYVAWIDAGETTCDASLSIGHCDLITINENGVEREVPAVILDDTLVWEPDQKLRRIVDIGSMTSACLDMCKYINLKAVFWDMWNSGTGVFDLRNAGIVCDKHNLTGEDYDHFKSVIYTNRFLAPASETTKKGVGQVKHLARTRTGNVSPGSPRHKKDIADTWCGITTLLLGSLVKVNLRKGRAPGSISIMSGNSDGAKALSAKAGMSSQAMGRMTNPFSGQMSTAGRQLMMGAKPVTNHADMFPGLGGLAGKGKSTSRGRVAPPTKTPGRISVPRGIRM